MSWQSAEVARKLLAESEGIDFGDSGHVINRQHGFSVASFDPGLRVGPTLLKGVPKDGELDRGTRQHAMAVCCDDKRRGSWKLCTVLARKGPSKLLVEWEEDCSHDEVLRLHCMLAHEDVHNFCQRVGRSLRARTSAEAFLRYNAFLDNMPFSGNPGLTDRQIGCILALAMNNARLKQRKISRTSIEVITSEVTSEYNRTINKMVLDAMLVNHQHKCGFPHLAPRKSIKKRPVPFLGTITLPLYDYQVRTATFLENTYMDKSEAIAALEAVRTECGKVIGLSMFQTKFTGTMDISDFSGVQTEQSKSTSQALKRVWCEKLRAEIFKAFSRVPEDSEMSIDISDRASFEGSKLQRLLITINFVMEETLRVLTEDACREYVDFVRTATAYHVEVLGTKDVSILYNNPFKDGCKECAPLFALELVPVAGAFKFSTPVDSFESEPVMLFDAALRMLHDVPQIMPSIMRRLFLGKQKFVKSVTEDCPLILNMRERMAADLKHACQPLRHYMRQFDSYLEFVNTDLAEYVRTYEEKEGTLGQDELEIEELLVLRKQVEDRVPQFIQVGTFNIKLQAISVFLFKKYSLLISMIMSIIAEKAASKSQIVVANFSSVHERLNIQTTNIEEVAALEDFIAEIPKNTGEVRAILGDTLQQFEVLDRFNVQLSDEHFKAKWDAYGWPRKIEGKIAEVQAQIVKDRNRQQEEMRMEQMNFEEALDEVEQAVNGFHKYSRLDEIRNISPEVRGLLQKLKDFADLSKKFQSRELLFGLERTDYDRVSRIQKSFEPYSHLWVSADDWLMSHKKWLHDPFDSLDPEQMEGVITETWRALFKAAKAFADLPECQACAEEVMRRIDNFKPVMPVVTALRNPGLRMRHWDKMSSALNFTMMPGQNLNTLEDVYRLKLIDHEEMLIKMCESAGKEYAIEEALDKMMKEWSQMEFEIVDYRTTGSYVLKGSDDVQQILDDNIVMTQAMSFSPFNKPHKERLEKWGTTLNLMTEIIEQWLNCQRNWMYLEPIFSSNDIMKQLPAEGQKFRACDRHWRKYLQLAHENPNCLEFSQTPDLLAVFTQTHNTLEQVQKGLSDYLETKRQAFARFYFLSNEELLEILSQTKDPRAVQPHLRKCFEAINRVDFENDLAMTCMYSGEGEQVIWDGKVYPEGNVEFWLTDVENMMQMSINTQIGISVNDYTEVDRKVWVLKWPGQIVLACDQIYWTRESEEAIERNDLECYYATLHQQLLDVTTLVRTELTNLQRISLSALVTLDVHGRDVVERLKQARVAFVSEFDWAAQLRYYWRESDEAFSGNEGAFLVQVENSFRYGCEYLGNSMRLVVTPLTDRIYLTLTGALGMALGGAPAGPAGTGKTETTKDLAKAMAKQCIVFNCQEGMDYIMVGKFFKGLAMCGAWACFDEFNRINIEVLSVIAQQLLTINQAIINKLERFLFEGVEISLNPENASFITMNPGYAGRTELPDNLKVLFRPVACMVPNYALIGEIRLFSFGFERPRELAEKMVNCFKLSSEQLSAQDHYDFGMRAVNTVISAAGLNKRKTPDADEAILMLRALKDSNLPKFLTDDIVLFTGIISDLFPGVRLPEPEYGSLMEMMEICTEHMGLQTVPTFMQKAIQLFDVTVLRHGLMTVGPTGGGKTCVKNMLANTLTKLKRDRNEYHEVRQLIMNPKSITMGQLYGSFDDATHEWADGILCKLFREAVYDTTEKQKWVVFDGPVDALWIESMNTVLDENKKLCLVSGEIITMTHWMRMVFEVEDLSVASPATVSRVGIIYLEPSTSVGSAAVVTSWLQTLPPAVECHKQQLLKLFDALLDEAIDFHKRNLREYIKTVEPNLWRSVLNLIDGFLIEYLSRDGEEIQKDRIDALKINIEPILLFSLTWGIAGACDSQSRSKFDEWIKGKKAIPFKATIFEQKYDVVDMKWCGWLDTITITPIDARKEFSDLIVQTPDSISYAFLIEHIMQQLNHVLCIGPTGTSKTLTIKQKLMHGMDEVVYSPIFLTFSAQTSANQTQDILDAKMDKRRKGVYGPPAGKRFTIFVDDMNMPLREVYFAQPPIEILRQWMDHQGWYDRKTHQKKTIIDICYIGAMGPPGGGRQPVTNRFLRHFNHIAFPELSETSMKMIFSKIFMAHIEMFFPAPLKAMVDPLCEASIEVYQKCLKELLPTPTKSHYTFNLRDLAKIFQGLMMADAKRIGDDSQMVMRLWAHECTRVFRDRLTDDQDRLWFNKLLRSLFDLAFKVQWDAVVPLQRVLFGDYMVPDSDPAPYCEIVDHIALRKVVESYLDEYNAQTNKPMKLVMFMDAIEHVSRISRILRQPKGNALLLGVGGSGRQSLTRLASFVAKMDCISIEITKGYGNVEWREDVKKVLLRAGMEGKETVFLFTDSQIVLESFLEDINGVLNSGEVPNIFDMADQDQITLAMRPICQAEGLPLTKHSMYERFLARVQSNLHIVLAFSPVGIAFQARLRNFPSLVTCCTINWFSEWPVEALRGVANDVFADVGSLDDQTKEGIVSMCGDIHKGVEMTSIRYKEELRRYNYVTPTSYLELLSTFRKVLAEKRDEIGSAKRRLTIGLDKLDSTEKDVGVMKVELTELQPVLERTAIEVDELMVKIERDKLAADETKHIVSVEEGAASKKAAECKEIKDSAEAGLAEALPALDAAVACLKNLKLSDISEVAKYSNPPLLVKLVIEALCVMFNIAPTKVGEAGKKVDDYWQPGKKLLGDARGTLDKMFEYDKDNISDRVIKKIQQYIDNPDFQPVKIQSVSSACTAMCQWTRAMHTYHYVALDVEPKRVALAAAMEELKVVEEKVSKLQAQLKEVTDRLDALNADFDAAIKKKQELAKKAEDCNVKLDRADRLLGGLGGEKVRWQKTVEDLESSMINVVGDVIIAAGGIAYLGAFTSVYRNKQENDWCQNLKTYSIPSTKGAGVRKTLSDAVKIRAWNIAGLPTDAISTENAIILSKSRRWSLMIDPQGQANKWLKNMYKGSMEVIKLTEKEFLRSLVNAVRFGKPILLENVGEELDPSLEPVLAKQTFRQGGSEMIKIGDETIAYHADFNFFITSRLPNPHYSPEACVKITLLNFTVNQSGLEDQILGLVVGKERPDLQEAKNQLVISMADMRGTQRELEDKILKLLAESEGDILADENLIVVLGEAKNTSNEITFKVAEAEKTEQEIDETREKYRPAAFRGSLLFFCASDLGLVDSMYQYSLQWFIALFDASLDNSAPADDVAQRCDNINEFFTYSLYKNICRGLFEKDKLLFSFTLCINLMQGDNRIDSQEWRFLLAGATSPDTALPNPARDWLVDSSWLDVSDLAKLKAFEDFDQDFTCNVATWRTYFDSPTCYMDVLPGEWNDKLDLLQKLLVLRCMRQDKMQDGIMAFVTAEMNVKFIEPPAFSLALAFEDSSPVVPLIFVLSSGVDPTMAWIAFAEEMGFQDRLDSISLGQGQGPIAERKLTLASKAGAWLLLQNCHLAVSWMPRMEMLIEAFDPSVLHPDFRLWLTAMPSPKFPVAVLQNAVKMTLEPPKGLKANVTGSFIEFSDNFFLECKQVESFKKLCFSLCWFHAVMQERRKFGPLGWNIAYDFSNSDRDCCVKQLRVFLDKYDTVPYKVIVELSGDVNYGGRITDDWDRRCMNTLLEEYVCPAAMEPGYHYSADDLYVQPPVGTHAEYLDVLKKWPIKPHPEAFGLHENADITCAQNEVKILFESVLMLQPRVSTGAGLSREDIIGKTAETLLEKTPQPWLMLDIQTAYPVMYEQSLNTVLQQECLRYNKLLVLMHSTLALVRKALKGIVVMSSELDTLATNLFNNQVPSVWDSKAYPSLKSLVLWQEDLGKRCAFIQNWIDNGVPVTFWISGFFFPQAFLTGTLQNYARAKQVGIDTVSFDFRNQAVKHTEITERVTDGCIIWGCFLEGARWDVEKTSLVESRPKELFTSYVPVYLCPVMHRQKPDSKVTLMCPCYKILTRKGVLSTTGHSTNFVMTFEIPTKYPPTHWIKRGVALFLALAY